MKIYFILVLMAVLFLGCMEEVNSPALNEPLLASIISDVPAHDDNLIFEYDTSNRLVRVEDHDKDQLIEYYYSNTTPTKILAFDTLGVLISMDSITSFQNNKIDKVYRYFTDDNGLLKGIAINEYLYNTEDQVERINFMSYSSGAINYYKTFAWLNGNITAINEYSASDHLFIENKFEYDLQKNYKRHSPYFYFDPLYTTNNNVVKFTFKDHTGLYDGICNPCLLNYQYNEQGYPIWFQYGDGPGHSINYK